LKQMDFNSIVRNKIHLKLRHKALARKSMNTN
jgi:hypothetical protein